jgi:zinc protease
MTLRRSLALGLLAVLVVAAASPGAPSPVHTRTLPNGCRLAVVENHQAPVVALRVAITNTGSLYEGEWLGCGLSHYAEHLVSGGTTPTRTEAESSRLKRSIGGSTNATTSRDLTNYHGETHVSYLDVMVDLFADWVRNASLDPKEVEREKGVIVQELIKGRDEPNRIAYQLLMETMFRVHPVRHPTIGYLDSFLGVSRDDLVRFVRSRYAPQNCVVVLAGDVDPQDALDRLEKAFGDWERGRETDLIAHLPAEPRQMDRRYAEAEADVRECLVRFGFHTIPLSHPDLHALDLLAAVLGHGRTSRLHRRLVEQDRLTDGIQVGSHTPRYGAGVFHVVAQCPSANVPAFEAALFEEIERLAAAPPTEEELRRAKALVERDFVLDVQRAADQAERVAMDLIGTGNPNYSAQYVERIRAVTGEQVQAMAGKYFSRDNESLVVVKPFGDPPVFGAEGGKKAPAAATETRKIVLPNGFTVVLQHNPATPSVGIEAFFRAGVLWESDENAGISNLMSRLMLRGTKTRTAARIAEELENVGARASAVSGNNTFGMSMSLPARELVPSLALFADLLRNPVFPAEEVEREKRVSQMLIHRQAGNWQTEAMRNFREAMFALHPYRRDRFGTLETIGAIDRDAVVAYHASHCTPANGVLAVFGDLDLDAAEKAVRAAFDDWPKGKALLREVQHEPEPTESRIVTYPSRKEQVVITLGFPGASLDSEDRWALQVIDAAISGLGYPSGRLHESLRGKRDLVYFVHAISWNGFAAGAFYVICPCQPKNYDEVIGIIRREMNRIAEEGLTPEELENAKRMCITVDQLSRQTNNERAMAAALDELYGFGWDASTKSAEKIRAVTNEDVKRVARQHFASSVLALTAPRAWLIERGLLKE